MHVHRAAPMVGARRPRVIAKFAIASITALVALQGATDPAAATSTAPMSRSCTAVTTLLTHASSGLLMPSESDFPFATFSWTPAAARPLTIARLLELTGHAPVTEVEVVDLRHFFRNVAFRQPWHDRQQAKDVGKFQRLVRALERHLGDVRVYRVGTIRIDAYVVGECGDDLVGLSTILIET